MTKYLFISARSPLCVEEPMHISVCATDGSLVDTARQPPNLGPAADVPGVCGLRAAGCRSVVSDSTGRPCHLGLLPGGGAAPAAGIR